MEAMLANTHACRESEGREPWLLVECVVSLRHTGRHMG